VACLGLQNSLV